MDSSQVIDQNFQQIGEEWIQALLEKDYQRLAGLCQADVRSRLMTPKRFDAFESLPDLTQKVAGWFQECTAFQKEQARIARVGEKLAIFYRVAFIKEGQPYHAEQQLYCTLRDGRIEQLNLLCSGFQPAQVPLEAPLPQAAGSAGVQASLRPDAFLKVDAGGAQGSTCAVLTPTIKHKLGEMSSGQVLEVRVDDPSARDDIEAWCRLSGNSLLRVDPPAGQELRFYLMKK